MTLLSPRVGNGKTSTQTVSVARKVSFKVRHALKIFPRPHRRRAQSRAILMSTAFGPQPFLWLPAIARRGNKTCTMWEREREINAGIEQMKRMENLWLVLGAGLIITGLGGGADCKILHVTYEDVRYVGVPLHSVTNGTLLHIYIEFYWYFHDSNRVWTTPT